MSQLINVSTSFIQDQKHAVKSDRFQVIQPVRIAEVLNDHGFDLVHLKTGKSRSPERADFQTTVARYRSRDNFEIDGLNFDLIFKVPHLYGALQGVLGLFRGVCANQINVGTHFETIKVRHTGNPYEELNQLIPMLVSQRTKLIETVNSMSQRQLSPDELIQLARQVASIRLEGVENIQTVNVEDLLKVRRDADVKNDLFSALNVIQENVIRYGLRYQLTSTDEHGSTRTRNQLTRKVKEESVKAIDLNASIWDAATKMLNVA